MSCTSKRGSSMERGTSRRVTRAPSYRATPPATLIQRYPSGVWVIPLTEVPGRPSRTCQTSTVHCDSIFPGSRAAAGRGNAQEVRSRVAEAIPKRMSGTASGSAILHAVAVGRAITDGQAMPGRPPLSPLPRWFFVLFGVVYLYAFPFFDQLRSANEMPRILMTQEMVDRGVFYLDRRLPEFGSTGDLSRGPDGHLYPNKAPGASFLAVPAYLVCKKLGFTSLRAVTWAFRVS